MDANWWLRRLAMALVAVAVVKCGGVEGNLITVGGRSGWNPGVNYTQWVTDQPSFHVGDWLLFRFNKYMYDVLEVNKTSYEQCNPQGFIQNVTKGGRDVVNLTESRTYYFICSKGYCYGGMKITINVSAEPQLAPAPSPDQNGVRRLLIVDGIVMNVVLGSLLVLVWVFCL